MRIDNKIWKRFSLDNLHSWIESKIINQKMKQNLYFQAYKKVIMHIMDNYSN